MMQFLLPSINFSLCRLHINEIKHHDPFESGFSHSTHFLKTYFCSVDAHVGCFQLLTITNKATRNTFVKVKCLLVAQLCPNLHDLMDCSLTGSSVRGILQARILEWVAAIPFSGASSRLRGQTQFSCIAGGFFTIWATRMAQEHICTHFVCVWI